MQNSHLHILCCIFLQLLLSLSSIARDTMYVSGEVYENVNKHFTFLNSTNDYATTENVIEALDAGQFQKWKNAPFHTGHGNVTFWFHLVLKNSNPNTQTYLWSFYKNSNYINLYQKNSEGIYELKYQNSVHLPLSKRPYKGKALSFPFELQADETVDLLVQINKTSTESPYLDHDVKEIKQWLRYDIKATTIITSFFSIFLLTSLFNLLLFFVFREKIYLGQWLLIFSFSLYTIHLYGVDVYLLPDKIYDYWSHIPLLIPVAVSYILLIVLFRRFVCLANDNSRLDKIFYWTTLIAVIGFSQFILVHYSINLFSSNAENYSAIIKISRLLCVVNNWTITALLLYGSIYYFYKGNGEIKIYAASMFVFMCSILLFLFIRYQTNTDTQLILHIGILLAFTFHIVILALLTINRFFKKHTENIALLRERNFIQEKLTTDIIKAQESERKRIAQELHDGVNGNMAALRLYINRQMHLFQEKLKNLELNNSFVIMQNQADDIINQIRSLSHRLLPKDFEDHVFSELVKSHIEQLNDSTNIQWTVIVDDEVNNISKDIQINLYRILMELCRNIIAHSGANTATIQLLYYPDNVQLLVEDNGIGFNPNATVDGIGLKNIRSRVDFFKGNFNIESNKFATTTIIEIPLTYE